MGMTRTEKQTEVEELHNRFANDEVVIVTHYSGLTVKALTNLRNSLRSEGASFKVTKNSLAKLAIKGTKFEHMADMFAGPTGIATAKDPVAVAKIVQKFVTDSKILTVVGGSLNGVSLDAKGVEQLSKLPSLNELRAKIIGLVQAPATKIVGVLQAPARNLVGVTRAYGEKK